MITNGQKRRAGRPAGNCQLDTTHEGGWSGSGRSGRRAWSVGERDATNMATNQPAARVFVLFYTHHFIQN